MQSAVYTVGVFQKEKTNCGNSVSAQRGLTQFCYSARHARTGWSKAINFLNYHHAEKVHYYKVLQKMTQDIIGLRKNKG